MRWKEMACWIAGLGIAAHAAVEMNVTDGTTNAGTCVVGYDALNINYVNNTPDPWDMRQYGMTIGNGRVTGAFAQQSTGGYFIAPGASPTINYASCNGNTGAIYNKQLMASIGSCNEPDPPETPVAEACSAVNTGGQFYNPTVCLKDAIGTAIGSNEYGGFINSYVNQTQIEVALPTATWTVNGHTVRFDPTASMGGPFYMMSLVALQEYLYADMQFMIGLGAKASNAGLVDATTGQSLYTSPPNIGTDTSAYGSFTMTYQTATGRLMVDYPKYFTGTAGMQGVTAMQTLVSTGGPPNIANIPAPTKGNSPEQINSAFLAAMDMWWLFDGLSAAQDLCFKEFIQDAADKTAGLKLMLGGYFIGPNVVDGGTGFNDDYATHVLPTTNQTILQAPDVTQYMKPYVWGVGGPDFNTQNYITQVFATINPLVAANTQSQACGGSLQIYDDTISLQEVQQLFFGEGGTAAKQGYGGLLWNFNIDATSRQGLWSDLICSFNALAGKAPSTAAYPNYISYRYDFLTVLRVARQYFTGYVNKFSDRPTPSDVYSSEYSIWVTNHSQHPCAQSTQDTTWPVMSLQDTVYGKGAPLTGTFTDNRGVKEYAYSTDTTWRAWIPTVPPPNFIIPTTLPNNTRMWYRITDSCGNATIQEVKLANIPPPPKLPKPNATPAGGNFYDSLVVTLTDSTLTGVTFYYTLDGSVPTTSSNSTTGSVTIKGNANVTLTAIAVKTGYTNSDAASWVFVHQTVPVTQPPTITPGGTTFTTLDPAVTVTITAGETGATIHYTTDGTTPDSNSAVYTGPLTVSATETVKAIDTKSGQLPSAVVSQTYTQTTAPKVAKPIATPPGVAGTSPYNFQTSPLAVALSDSTSGAVISYSLNGVAFVSGTAVTITQSGTLKVYATKAGMYPSDTLVIQYNYTPPAQVVKAWYLDANGDGSIDEAVVVFNQALPVLPTKLDFKIGEANNQIEDRSVSGTAIAFSGSGDSMVLVTFPTPFKQGVTSLGAGTIGQVFAQANIPLLDGTFPLNDSVPPVILSGTVFQPDSSSPLERVVLMLSEPSAAPANSQTAFIFKRAADLFPGGSVVVDGIQQTSATEYTLLIDSTSSQPPIVGDSVAIEADGEVKDALGNAPAQRLFVKLGGTPPQPAPVRVYVYFPNGSTKPDNTATPEAPTTQSNVIFIPIGADNNALPGSDNGKCGTCIVGKNNVAPPFVGPIINVVIPGPVNYEFQIFSNLGEFVVSGSGQVVAADLPLLDKVQGGTMYLARFVWTGRSAQGAKAGTGAYILQCTIHTELDPRTGAPPSAQTKRILFGLIRQNGS